MQTPTPRQSTILNRVIEQYIETAQPVGSRRIVELFHGLYRSTYSPATIRNEMGVLERRGYLTHPHTSAGRIPTDHGYRYYVHHGLGPDEEKGSGRTTDWFDLSAGKEWAVDHLMDAAASELSLRTGQMTCFIVPQQSVRGSRKQYRLYIHGSSRLLGQPEFQDVRKAQAIFRRLEEKYEFAEWLARRVDRRQVSVFIGRDNESEELDDCTLLSSRIPAVKREVFAAVIGPRRMHYASNLRALRLITASLYRLLQEQENG